MIPCNVELNNDSVISAVAGCGQSSGEKGYRGAKEEIQAGVLGDDWMEKGDWINLSLLKRDVSSTSSALKTKRRTTASDASSLNNIRSLYHVATCRKQGCDPSWVPTHHLRSQGFTGSVNVVCNERMG